MRFLVGTGRAVAEKLAHKCANPHPLPDITTQSIAQAAWQGAPAPPSPLESWPFRLLPNCDMRGS